MNKIDRYLAVLFAMLGAFVVAMIILFNSYQSTPDTLIISVFGLAGGEFGILGLIKRSKERNKNKEEDDDAAG